MTTQYHLQQRVERFSALQQIIETARPSGQDEIRLALARRGLYISQSQLSRDLARLHVKKQDGHYVIVPDPRYKRLP